MSDLELIKISALPQADSLNDYDLIPVVQNGETKSASISKLPGSINSGTIESNSADVQLVVPAGRILAKFLIKSNAGFSFSLSSGTAGLENELSGETIVADTPRLFTVDITDWEADIDVFFEGLTGNVKIKYFLMG